MSKAPPTVESNESALGIARHVATLLGRRTIAALIVTIVSSVALAFIELAVALFLQLFLKSIGILGPDIRTPFGLAPSPAVLAISLASIALVRSGSQFLAAQSSYLSLETISARVRRLAIWEMLLHPSKRVMPAASVNARVGDLAAKASWFCYFAANLLGFAVQAIALVPLMLFTAPGETTVALFGLGLVAVFVLYLNRRARALTKAAPAELRVMTEGIERVARNALLVRVLRTQALEYRQLVTAVDAYRKHLVRAGFLGSIAAVIPPFVGVLLLLGVIALSQRVLGTPGMTLLAFLYLFVRFIGAAGACAATASNCSTNWSAFKDTLDYFSSFTRDEVEQSMHVGESLVGRSFELTKSDGGEAPAIEITSLGFIYPKTTTNVLQAISVEIPKGAQLAIVGPSGCGKSTLLGLVLGVLDPTRGAIKVGGRTPAAFFDDPQTRVGYVGAEPFLIAGSIRENLRYGISVDADDAQLLSALESARLRATVEGLPSRLDYTIAEDGSGLSAGQKQRLCLARALLNRPHVLVLDEVSANLDTDTEAEIAESLKDLRGTCTTILVSHRQGILKYADRVITLGQQT